MDRGPKAHSRHYTPGLDLDLVLGRCLHAALDDGARSVGSSIGIIAKWRGSAWGPLKTKASNVTIFLVAQ